MFSNDSFHVGALKISFQINIHTGKHKLYLLFVVMTIINIV